MRRTLFTVLTFAVCATGVGYAAADLMPDPGTSTPAQHAAAVAVLTAPERGLEPIARPAMPSQPATPETTAPAVPTLERTPVAGVAPSSTVTPRAVEAPAPAAVNPQPVPVAAPEPAAPADRTPIVVDEGPCFRADPECYGEPGDYAPQLDDEIAGRATDALEVTP